MRFQRDTVAASPLVVIATFVLGAIVVTALAYALLFDRPEPELRLVEQRGDDGSISFEVAATAGGLTWGDLTVRFLDRAGTDQAANFLHLPDGDVVRGQDLTVQPRPAAGTYVLVVTHEGAELARLTVLL